MKPVFTTAILLGLTLRCQSLADQPARLATAPQLIVAPNARGSEMRIVEVGKPGSEIVIAGLARAIFPNWRKKDRRLLFTSDASGRFQLYAMEDTGGVAQNLTNTSSNDDQPDGRYLAYVHFARHPDQCPEGGRLMLFDIEEGTSKELGDGSPRVTASRMGWRPEEK